MGTHGEHLSTSNENFSVICAGIFTVVGRGVSCQQPEENMLLLL